jgi:hypothetical protein
VIKVVEFFGNLGTVNRLNQKAGKHPQWIGQSHQSSCFAPLIISKPLISDDAYTSNLKWRTHSDDSLTNDYPPILTINFRKCSNPAANKSEGNRDELDCSESAVIIHVSGDKETGKEDWQTHA